MEALLVAIHELRPDWSAEFIKWIMDLVELNLTSSVGKFGNLWYRNKWEWLLGVPYQFHWQT